MAFNCGQNIHKLIGGDQTLTGLEKTLRQSKWLYVGSQITMSFFSLGASLLSTSEQQLNSTPSD